MRRFLLNILALIALALLCALATTTVNAQDSPYSWESIDVLIDVQQNGDILVEETSAYAFHVQHDFFRSRYIDMEFIDHIDQVSVSMDGRDLPVETDRGEQRFQIGWEHLSVNAPETRTVGLFSLQGLVDAPTPNWKGASWVFEKTRLISRYPSVNWERVTYLLYWSLRFSPFGLFALLFVAIRIRNSRWPDVDYPQGPAGLTTLPSDLPAPAVSVFFSRKVGPQTYLSILVDMLQKSNLTITGRYDESDKERKFHSGVNFVRQFEPDQPWEKVVYDDLPVRRATSEELTGILKKRKNAIRTHLDELLQSRGIFDEPPLQVMADQGQGWMAQFGWFLASAILALGVGLWVNFWLPWWAGVAVGIPIAVVFLVYAWNSPAGRLIPTPAGLLEMSRWAAFSRSIGDGHVSPSLDPSQPDPLLPYAVALNEASQWVNDINALPPWFLPGGPREQTPGGLYTAYRGFIGADSWDLAGGPNKKPFSAQSGGGGGGDGGGDGGGG